MNYRYKFSLKKDKITWLKPKFRKLLRSILIPENHWLQHSLILRHHLWYQSNAHLTTTETKCFWWVMLLMQWFHSMVKEWIVALKIVLSLMNYLACFTMILTKYWILLLNIELKTAMQSLTWPCIITSKWEIWSIQGNQTNTCLRIDQSIRTYEFITIWLDIECKDIECKDNQHLN